ncbi:TMEM64 (predicted) [Pycnogonum litorale]
MNCGLTLENGAKNTTSDANKCSFCTVCKTCCLSSVLALIFILVLYIIQDYIQLLLLWLEAEDDYIVIFLFMFLYICVAFPFCWGYLLLNLISGYRFGLIGGIIVTLFGVSLGLLISHSITYYCCGETMQQRLLKNDYIRATFSILQKDSQTLKVIAIARLTPVPYGLQNAVFAVSSVKLWKYMVASIIGLLPIQIVNIYLGSTFRSIEDVFHDDPTSVTGHCVFILQLLIGVLLTIFIARKAKIELNHTLEFHLADETKHGNDHELNIIID